VHYIICTYISPETSSLVEEATYPAALGETASSIEGTAVEEDEKTGVVAREKEAESPV
jgi:hypothetical protein